MCNSVTIIRSRQISIRREMDRRGIALKAVEFDSGIAYATLQSYFPQDGAREPAQIPGGAIYSLCGALPADLLSLLLPDGFQIVRAPEAMDHDDLARKVLAFQTVKAASHCPESPGGREISPCEDVKLRECAADMGIAA